jgi:hypothetical protein
MTSPPPLLPWLPLAALLACSGGPGAKEDHAGPRITALTPSAGDANASVHAPIRATFSEPVENGSIGDSSVLLSGPGGVALAKTLSLSADGTQLTVVPVVAPAAPTTLTVTLTSAIRDRFGNPLEPPAQPWSFTLPAWRQLGPPPASSRGAQIAVNAAGVPFAAWSLQTGGIVAGRWSGTAWELLGGPLNLDPTQGNSRPAISLDAAGQPIVLWDEFTATAADPLFAKRWSGGAWGQLGSVMNFNLGREVYDRVLAPGASDQPVAAWEEPEAVGQHIYVRQWSSTLSQWQFLGGGPVTPDATLLPQWPSLARDGAGNAWVAWSETTAAGATQVQVRSWDGTIWHPVGGPLVGGLPSLEVQGDRAWVAAEVAGTCASLDCTRIQVSTWTSAAGWTPLGEARNRRGGSANRPVLRAGPGGAVAVLWAEGFSDAAGASGEELYLDLWEGAGWRPVGGPLLGGVGSSFTYPPTLALDGSGVAHAAAEGQIVVENR